jgi:hypothetical protein
VTRRLYRPRLVTVSTRPSGDPAAVGCAEVEAVREQWLVEDRWWTGRQLRRRYFELITGDGRDIVVFCDLNSGRWYSQRGA